MKILLLCGLCVTAFAQISLDIGSASESACTGSKWGSAQQASMGNQAPPFSTLRYAASFSCAIPAPIGTCQVTLLFLENRPAVATPTVPASGPGLRIFTASVNGVSTGPLDLFALAGAQTPYTAPPITVPVSDGLLHLNLTALPGKGNATLSGVQATCQAPATPSALPKFITETFAVSAGQPTSATLGKTPVPDSGMFLTFSNGYVGYQFTTFVRPEASKSLTFVPPQTFFDGNLLVGYWTAE